MLEALIRLTGMGKHTDLVSKLALTSQPPMAEPNIWNAMYRTHRGSVVKRPKNVAIVMVGLRWAPEIGPMVYINRGSMKTTITLPINPGTIGPVSRFLFHFVITACRVKGKR